MDCGTQQALAGRMDCGTQQALAGNGLVGGNGLWDTTDCGTQQALVGIVLEMSSSRFTTARLSPATACGSP
jgi:hypothetical protein